MRLAARECPWNTSFDFAARTSEWGLASATAWLFCVLCEEKKKELQELEEAGLGLVG